ncbi:WD40 repeat-like protein [Marasmius fiardii PR-910]|nr:WD40 repeat-like protein [Marasmius fiardii PR-910]
MDHHHRMSSTSSVMISSTTSSSQRPQLILHPSVNKTTVVTTTTTTTTYAPIHLPPLPPPPSPSTYDPKTYPLLHAALPPSLRNIELLLPGGVHATLRDSDHSASFEMKEEEEVASSGRGWTIVKPGQTSAGGGHTTRSTSVGLAEALERYSQTAKKRAKDDDGEDEMEGIEFYSPDAPESAPPRKKARGPPSSPPATGQPISPLPSPHGSPPPPEVFSPQQYHHISPPPQSAPSLGAPPPFQPDLSLTTLLTLPSLLTHFSSLPPSLQSHLLLTLLRHSPLPVLRSVHSVLTPTLARDFLTLLPPELVQNVLGWLEWPTLVRMTRVSRGWKSIVDGDGVLWRGVMKRERVWWGGEMEEGWERWLRGRRRKRGPGNSDNDRRTREIDDEADIQTSGPSGAYPSPRNSTVVLPGTASSASRHVPTPTSPSHPSSYPSDRQQEPAMSSGNPPINPPHPYKILYKSRHLTRHQWLTNPTPRHINFQAHGHSVVTCLIFADIGVAPSSQRSSGFRKRIISASDDHSIHVYSPSTGALEMRLEGHEGGVWALAAMGGLLVSGSTDRTVRVWDLDNGESSGSESEVEEGGTVGSTRKGKCLHVFGGHTSTVRCLAIVKPEIVDVGGEFGGDGPQRKEKWPKRPLIVTGSRDHSLRVWILPRKGEQEYKCTNSGSGSREDGTGSGDADVCDAEENPYHLLHLEGHEHAVRALAARGRTLVSGSYDCNVRVWDIVTGKCRFVLTGHGQKVYSVVLDPIRHTTASGSMDGTVRVWSTLDGSCHHVLTGHTSLVGLLGLSPSHLVSAAADSTLRIWDVERGECKAVLAAHTGAITCFQHDEFKVVSGSDGTLKVWDLRAATAASAEDNTSAPVAGTAPPAPAAGLAFGGGAGGGAVAGAVAPAGGAGPGGGAGAAGGTTVPVRDLLTGITGVWQVAFEGRWCVAASNRNDQTVLDVWDFGRRDGDVDVSELFAGEGGEAGQGPSRSGQVQDFEEDYGDDEDGVYEEGWIGEPPGGMYEEEDSDMEEHDGVMRPRLHRLSRARDDESDSDDDDTFDGGGSGRGAGSGSGKGKGKSRGGGGGSTSRKASSTTLRYPDADEDAVMGHEDQDVLIIEDDDDEMSLGTAASVAGRSVSPHVVGSSTTTSLNSKISGSRKKATGSNAKHRRQVAQSILIEDGEEDHDAAMDIVATAAPASTSTNGIYLQHQGSSRGTSSTQTDSSTTRSDSEGPGVGKRTTRASGRKEAGGSGAVAGGNGRRRKWL